MTGNTNPIEENWGAYSNTNGTYQLDFHVKRIADVQSSGEGVQRSVIFFISGLIHQKAVIGSFPLDLSFSPENEMETAESIIYNCDYQAFTGNLFYLTPESGSVQLIQKTGSGATFSRAFNGSSYLFQAVGEDSLYYVIQDASGYSSILVSNFDGTNETVVMSPRQLTITSLTVDYPVSEDVIVTTTTTTTSGTQIFQLSWCTVTLYMIGSVYYCNFLSLLF